MPSIYRLIDRIRKGLYTCVATYLFDHAQSVPTGTHNLQNAIMDTPARALTTNVNGTNRNNNTTRIDGAQSINLFLPHHARKYPRGLYQVGHMKLYTNRGLGTTGMRIRVNCRPEITLFTLTSSEVEPS